jgi:hypothetical protein
VPNRHGPLRFQVGTDELAATTPLRVPPSAVVRSGTLEHSSRERAERTTARHRRRHSVPSQLQRDVTLGLQRNKGTANDAPSAPWLTAPPLSTGPTPRGPGQGHLTPKTRTYTWLHPRTGSLPCVLRNSGQQPPAPVPAIAHCVGQHRFTPAIATCQAEWRIQAKLASSVPLNMLSDALLRAWKWSI